MRDAPVCARAVSFGAACERCVAAFCCRELTTCFATSECVNLNDCALGCGDTSEREACRTDCTSKRPDAQSAFQDWDSCVRARCEAECPRGVED
jgi:hypothetical protein